MKKLIYLTVSMLIFAVISPFFQGIFTYLLFMVDDYLISDIRFDDFIFIIALAYILTAIPAIITGILYGFLSPSRHPNTLIWLIPILGSVIYLLYAFIFEMVTSIVGDSIIYLSLIVALLSIGGTFFSTLVANMSIKIYHLSAQQSE